MTDEHIHTSDGSTANPSRLVCKKCGNTYSYDTNLHNSIKPMTDELDKILNMVAKGARRDGFFARDLIAYPNQSDEYMKPAKQAVQALIERECNRARIDQLTELDTFVLPSGVAVFGLTETGWNATIAELQSNTDGDKK